MIDTPPFLDTRRPDVPDLVVAGGIVPFYLSHSPVRGRLVRLGALTDALLSRHRNPPAVSVLAGQALALVASMASALKFQGSFSLQIKGDGPVSTLLADSTDRGDLRFFARLRDDEGETGKSREGAPKGDARSLLGDGYLAFTVDQGPDMERHQGVVDLAGRSLSEMAMHYFRTSEQHDCWIRLYCTHTLEGWRAGALVLERIAAQGGIEGFHQDDHTQGYHTQGYHTQGDDAWETACTFAETLSENEIFDEALSGKSLIGRLFGTLEVSTGTPRALSYGCRCSRARLASVLERFNEDDLDHMVENGAITMNCEFCNIGFRFTRDELGERAP